MYARARAPDRSVHTIAGAPAIKTASCIEEADVNALIDRSFHVKEQEQKGQPISATHALTENWHTKPRQ